METTPTKFKPKTCPKCKNIHSNPGPLCSFCVAQEEDKKAKIRPMPANYFVKCLIQREGDTTLNIGNIQYTFRRNERGDSVCEIINPGHYEQILKSSFYEAYSPEEEAPKEEPKQESKAPQQLFNEEDATIINAMALSGKKAKEIAAALSEHRNIEVPWQRVVTFLKSRETKNEE